MTEIILANNNLPSTIEDLAKFVLIGRDRMTAVRAEIRAIDKLGLASTVHKQKLAEAQDIAEVVLDAEVKLGYLMKQITPLPRIENLRKSNDGPSGKSKAETIADLDFSSTQSKRLQELSAHVELVEQAKAEAREKNTIVTQSDVQKKIAQKKTTEKREEAQDPGKLPDGIFQVIYCDPPWQYDNSGLNGGAESHYSTMSLDELKAMNIKSISAENSVVFMWATNPMLKDALELMVAWGFQYKTNMVWVKDRKNYGKLGFYVYGQHELLLIGTSGSMLPMGEKPTSIITGANNIHSKKPECVYGIIETMYPGLKYVELFSRNSERGNWAKWGNEVGKYE
jgi:N6-adenosine-specific RNA methylase IME4